MNFPKPAITTIMLISLLLSACGKPTSIPADVSASELGATRNVHRSGDIFFSAQPVADDWEAIRQAGIQTVVTLRHNEEVTEFNEQEIVTGLGMEFVQVPFGSAAELTDSVIEDVRSKLKSAEKPLLLHCASANRVGAVWIPYRVLDQGIPYEQALDEAKEIGLRSAAYQERVEAYLDSRQ